MSEFTSVANVGEIPEGQGRTFSIGGRRIAAFRSAGKYYALDDRCPHMGASLSLGEVRDGTVVCDPPASNAQPPNAYRSVTGITRQRKPCRGCVA